MIRNWCLYSEPPYHLVRLQMSIFFLAQRLNNSHLGGIIFKTNVLNQLSELDLVVCVGALKKSILLTLDSKAGVL